MGAIKNAFARKNLPLVPLASAGLAKGVYAEFVRPNPGTVAWGTLIAGVLTYDFFCPKGQTLSETVDTALDKHKLTTIAVIGATALHLLNVIPERYDVLHRLTMLGKG